MSKNERLVSALESIEAAIIHIDTDDRAVCAQLECMSDTLETLCEHVKTMNGHLESIADSLSEKKRRKTE